MSKLNELHKQLDNLWKDIELATVIGAVWALAYFGTRIWLGN